MKEELTKKVIDGVTEKINEIEKSLNNDESLRVKKTYHGIKDQTISARMQPNRIVVVIDYDQTTSISDKE